jgi:hypothetical protein
VRGRTVSRSPVDTDPTLPLTRDLDVIVPDLGYPGWLRVVFIDGSGNQEPTEPVYVGSAIRPTVLEVANLMPDRTTIQGGAEAGTFTTGTTPTATQVDALIDLVIDTVGPRVGPDADGEVQRAARSIVALQTAILAEATYFSHQGDVNDRRIEVWQSLDRAAHGHAERRRERQPRRRCPGVRDADHDDHDGAVSRTRRGSCREARA